MISWFMIGLLGLVIKVLVNIFSRIPVINHIGLISFIAHAWYLYPLSFGLMVYGFIKDWRWAIGIALLITLFMWMGGFSAI